MPELPEVETVRRELKSKILGHKILGVTTNWPKIIKNTETKKFEKEVIGHVIEDISRKGKFIILGLTGGKNIIIHLRMTGNLLVSSCFSMGKSGSVRKTGDFCSEEENKLLEEGKTKHIHLSFSLNKNKNLLLMDVRKFATIQLVENKNIETYLSSRLGIDAISPDLNFPEFLNILKSRITEIKKLLLDQKRIAGIGNIYADEILFDSRISPKRKTNMIKKDEARRIFSSMKKILAKAIEMGGTTFSDFRNTEGGKGLYGTKNKVYKKEGKFCPKNCGSVIKKITLAGRGTRYCPRCQK